MPFASSASLSSISSHDHGLALGHRAGAGGAAELEHDRARLGGIARPMDLAALLDHLLLEGLEVEVEMGQRVVLDRLGGVAQGLELGQTLRGALALARKAAAGDRACCSTGSASARWALSLKASEVGCMSGPSRS